MKQIQANALSIGDTILDFGPVTSVSVNHRNEAVREATPEGIDPGRLRHVDSLMRARLAAEAEEQTYRRVPASITVTTVGRTKTYGLLEMVTVAAGRLTYSKAA